MVKRISAERPIRPGGSGVGRRDPLGAVHPRHPRLDPDAVSGTLSPSLPPVAVAIAGAVVVALVRIRDRRLARWRDRHGTAARDRLRDLERARHSRVDAVERFHFVEYGVVTLLFYRAWRRFGDASIVVLPVLAGLLVGTLEEWLQWFIPGRVGDMRDVFLNGAAIVSGLLFSLGLDPPERLSFELRHGSWRRIRTMAAIVTLVFAAFVHVVHLGYEISDPVAGRFRSRYDVPALARISQDRASQWATAPHCSGRSAGRAKISMSEGLLRAGAEPQVVGWRLRPGVVGEPHPGNVLRTGPRRAVIRVEEGHRWPDAQRSDADQRSRSSRLGQSREHGRCGRRKHLSVSGRVDFWTVVLISVAAIVLITTMLNRSATNKQPDALRLIRVIRVFRIPLWVVPWQLVRLERSG